MGVYFDPGRFMNSKVNRFKRDLTRRTSSYQIVDDQNITNNNEKTSNATEMKLSQHEESRTVAKIRIYEESKHEQNKKSPAILENNLNLQQLYVSFGDKKILKLFLIYAFVIISLLSFLNSVVSILCNDELISFYKLMFTNILVMVILLTYKFLMILSQFIQNKDFYSTCNL